MFYTKAPHNSLFVYVETRLRRPVPTGLYVAIESDVTQCPCTMAPSRVAKGDDLQGEDERLVQQFEQRTPRSQVAFFQPLPQAILESFPLTQHASDALLGVCSVFPDEILVAIRLLQQKSTIFL